MSDSPMLYVGTYAKYNNGSIEGAWLKLSDYMDAKEFYEACNELHADEEDPELMFQDFDNFPKCFYSECSPDINGIYEYMEACENFDKELVDAVLDDGGCLDGIENYFYVSDFDSDYDIGVNYIEQLYGDIENLDKETLARYFDFKAFGRDLQYNYTKVVTESGDVYFGC